jgi:HEPN domain-containing protein
MITTRISGNGSVEYLDLANYDLETAEVLLKGGRYLYVGFMCHKVIEKSLKACYLHNFGKVPPRTHNLLYLAELCRIYEDM